MSRIIRRSKDGLTEVEKQAFLEECCCEGAGIEEMQDMAKHVNFFGYDDEPEEEYEADPEDEPEDFHEDDLVNCLKEDDE